MSSIVLPVRVFAALNSQGCFTSSTDDCCATTEQEVIERIAVECQAGAFEDKLGEGEETSGGSHDDLRGGRRRNRPWVRKFLPSPGVAH